MSNGRASTTRAPISRVMCAMNALLLSSFVCLVLLSDIVIFHVVAVTVVVLPLTAVAVVVLPVTLVVLPTVVPVVAFVVVGAKAMKRSGSTLMAPTCNGDGQDWRAGNLPTVDTNSARKSFAYSGTDTLDADCPDNSTKKATMLLPSMVTAPTLPYRSTTEVTGTRAILATTPATAADKWPKAEGSKPQDSRGTSSIAIRALLSGKQVLSEQDLQSDSKREPGTAFQVPSSGCTPSEGTASRL